MAPVPDRSDGHASPQLAHGRTDRPPLPFFAPSNASPGAGVGRAPGRGSQPTSSRLEVVRGTVVASGRQVTGSYVPQGGGHAAIRSTPELWMALPDGSERRLLGDPLANARPGHEVAVVLGEEGRVERVLCLVNLSTRTATLGEPADPERALVRSPSDLVASAGLWSFALAVPVIMATMWVALGLADLLLPGRASEAAVGPAFLLSLLMVPVASVWLARHRARQDLARREARLAGVEAALAAVGLDLGPGRGGPGALASASRA